MAPLGRASYPTDERILANATRSAVLVLLYPRGDAATTVLIKRTAYEGVHSAQVSFPGGRHEEQDGDQYTTAVREAHEEIGIHPQGIEMIGPLTRLYIPPSKYLVYPFVASTEGRPDFTPDPHEVQQVIELDLETLLDDSRVRRKTMMLATGAVTEIPYFEIHGHEVWGATAMILSELKALMLQSS